MRTVFDRYRSRVPVAPLTGQVVLVQFCQPPVPPTVQTSDVPFPLQNFFYAFQWWIFAGFGVVVYLRWLWLESAQVDEDAVVT